MNPLCTANIEVLDQLKELIELTSNCYLPKPGSPHAGIGQHARHILDHYRALKKGLPDSVIDYNLRSRNSPEERSPTEGISQVNELTDWLHSIELNTKQSIEIISEISVQQTEILSMGSTVERELLYLINHSIHHMALASVLATSMGVAVPRYIGLAPGTASYERTKQTTAEHRHA
ncbi:MAG: DinB family protein [Reinekea sp.]|jgi:hypothetical protein